MRSRTSLLASIAVLVVASSGARSSEALAVGAEGTAAAPRILYSSDWTGTFQIYAVDPARRSTRQLTFGRPTACRPGNPCGWVEPQPSPDGRWLVLEDFAVQGPLVRTLYMSRADGHGLRKIGVGRYPVTDASWSSDSTRLAYTAPDGIHIVTRQGKNRRLRLGPTDGRPAWSPTEASLAFIDSTRSHGFETVRVAAGTDVRVVARSDQYDLDFAWSPSGRLIAYRSYAGLFVVPPDGYQGRRLAAAADSFAWSPDGSRIAVVDEAGLRVVGVAKGTTQRVVHDHVASFAWSPDGRTIAFVTKGGVEIVRASGGGRRVLSSDPAQGLQWASDGRSLTYLVPTAFRSDVGGASDIRTTTLSGVTRTLVDTAGDYGGAIRDMVSTRLASGLDYRAPALRPLRAVSADRLIAPWPVDRLAADGDRVAFAACGHVFAWTPSATRIVQTEPTTSLSPACQSATYYTSYRVYDLAIAGDRVAFGTVVGGNGRVWWLATTTLGPRPRTSALGEGYSTNGLAYSGTLVGELAGSRGLLVFSSWTEALDASRTRTVTTGQDARVAPPEGCPCPPIASSPGPLVPLDVDGGRAVVVGDNETWLLDDMGTRLLTLPVAASDAQLSANDLVLVRRGELRHYNATTGELLHTWPVPDAVGRECGSPNLGWCASTQASLLVQDLSHGLVAYVRDARVHLLRLSDGAEAIVARGFAARYLDAGLVYVDMARTGIELVPFDRLPLT